MADDTTILGTAHVQSARSGSFFQRATGRGGTTGNVSASLKFDIPGLKDFKGQLDAINKSLDTLNVTFAKLAKAPEAFSKQLENAVKQMKVLQSVQLQGNRYVTQGTPPQRDPVGQATAAAQGAGNGGGGGGGAGGGGGKGSVGESVTKVIDAMMKRFDAGMQQAISADVYASRMATYAGPGSPSTAPAIFRNQGKKGFGFMATDFVQGNQVQYQGTGIGAYIGAEGRAGQWGSAYQRSIKQMQEIMPGLDATQGAAAQTAIYGNVSGIKMTRALLGAGASPYAKNGERKTQSEYFKDILNALQRQPRRNGKTGNWTKEEIMKQNFPGSTLNLWLSTVLPEEAIPMWYEWAISNAAVGGNLSTDPNVAKKQLESVRGRSLATNAQETTNREAQKDAMFAGEQSGAMNARLDYEKKSLGFLQAIDTATSGIYGILGRVPSLLQNPVSQGIGGIVDAVIGPWTGLLGGGGDPGYMPMGDPEGSTSHLTPDLRKRVSAMMAANPNLKISSAYRDNKRQGDLQGKGAFAPSGKSKHGRGQAIDLGPSNQLGWIAKNARKFGLDSATGYNEPWHVQLAGSLTMGDPAGPDPSAAARATETELNKSVVSAITARWLANSRTATPTASGTGAAPSAGATSSGSTADLTAGSDGTLSADQVVQTLFNAGFRGETLVTMAGIARRESSWTPSAHRTNNPNRSDVGDFGLLQINYTNVPALVKAGVIDGVNDLLDPSKNAAAAYFLSKGGTSLSSWNATKGKGFDPNGSPMAGVSQSALDAARAAATAHGYLGDPGYTSGTSGGGGANVNIGGGTSLVFNNTFQLSFPNGATKASIDTAVRQIATRLEPQLARLVPRTN